MKHPLSQFLYCPKCGSSHFEIHNEKSKKCVDCGFVYYFNPSSATVALILNDNNELLVCRRAKSRRKELWIFRVVLLIWMKQVKKALPRSFGRNKPESKRSHLPIFTAQHLYLFRFPGSHLGYVFPLYRRKYGILLCNGWCIRLFFCTFV